VVAVARVEPRQRVIGSQILAAAYAAIVGSWRRSIVVRVSLALTVGLVAAVVPAAVARAADADADVFAFGDAHFYGSTGTVALNDRIVGMAATPTGDGYWLVARDGGIFTFGDARFDGSTAGRRLAGPIVGMAATSSGNGYWLAGADGSVYAFGGAAPLGGTTAGPVVAITTEASG